MTIFISILGFVAFAWIAAVILALGNDAGTVFIAGLAGAIIVLCADIISKLNTLLKRENAAEKKDIKPAEAKEEDKKD